MEPIAVDLSGVPQTLLWNLGRRAAAARAAGSPLDDPLAVEVSERLQYDFGDASRGAMWHAVRVATFDAAVRRFLRTHPAGTVVALGEGLETQFWRVDNGRVRWLTVDLPTTLDLRRQVLPDGPRQSSWAGSALDLTWLDQLDPAAPVLVTAQGLVPYFQRSEVHELIAAIAERLPGSLLVFDVVPEKMLELVRKTSGRERDQAVELWSWVFSAQERAAIGTIPGVAEIADLVPPRALGVVPVALRAVRRLPRRVRYGLPVFPVLQVRFR
ncbi:MAG TPA: class I SAM-dependent methyltransferase [Trebonia sp.]|jgi:O-methyltransferase involved in polyketide biosynthesis|nr:class I SAM-dependent methyltransferase [Trebonia sp.]